MLPNHLSGSRYRLLRRRWLKSSDEKVEELGRNGPDYMTSMAPFMPLLPPRMRHTTTTLLFSVHQIHNWENDFKEILKWLHLTAVAAAELWIFAPSCISLAVYFDRSESVPSKYPSSNFFRNVVLHDSECGELSNASTVTKHISTVYHSHEQHLKRLRE